MARLAEILRWEHDVELGPQREPVAVAYCWDGLILSSDDSTRGARFAAPGHRFGERIEREMGTRAEARSLQSSLMLLAEGALIEAPGSRAAALLVERLRNAVARLQGDVRAFCERDMLADADELVATVEGLTLDREFVIPEELA